MGRATDVDVIIGSNLRLLRTHHRLEQKDVAARMNARGHSTWWATTVSNIECGRRAVLVSEAESLRDIFLLNNAARLWSGPLILADLL